MLPDEVDFLGIQLIKYHLVLAITVVCIAVNTTSDGIGFGINKFIVWRKNKKLSGDGKGVQTQEEKTKRKERKLNTKELQMDPLSSQMNLQVTLQTNLQGVPQINSQGGLQLNFQGSPNIYCQPQRGYFREYSQEQPMTPLTIKISKSN
uniref:Transmembrane protein n=1 Tax=Strongyloides stercoralis TaxID=6248 RepID=A0A913IBH3_STRER